MFEGRRCIFEFHDSEFHPGATRCIRSTNLFPPRCAEPWLIVPGSRRHFVDLVPARDRVIHIDHMSPFADYDVEDDGQSALPLNAI